MEIIDWFLEWDSHRNSIRGDIVYVVTLDEDERYFGKPAAEGNKSGIFGLYIVDKKAMIYPLVRIWEDGVLLYQRHIMGGWDDNQKSRKARKLIRAYREENNLT